MKTFKCMHCGERQTAGDFMVHVKLCVAKRIAKLAAATIAFVLVVASTPALAQSERGAVVRSLQPCNASLEAGAVCAYVPPPPCDFYQTPLGTDCRLIAWSAPGAPPAPAPPAESRFTFLIPIRITGDVYYTPGAAPPDHIPVTVILPRGARFLSTIMATALAWDGGYADACSTATSVQYYGAVGVSTACAE